jgi:hypothetical protein
MINVRASFAALVVVTATAALQTMGCFGGCGVGPAEGPNSGNGSVTFDRTSVGASEVLPIPFQDSAFVDETITGASITGPDAAAFEVISTFPIAVPAGQSVEVQIRFSPTHEGDASATLVLETEEMGPSSVQLDGTGVAAGG